MMLRLLNGTAPPIDDVLFVKAAILDRMDIYKPMDVAKQLLEQAGNFDVSSARLMR